jgi:hypothetical protein
MRCFVILALVQVATGVGCDGHTAVKGRVVDPAWKPITGATVKLIQLPNGPDPGRTDTKTMDGDGQFEVGITHAPTKTMLFLFEVSKEGFAEHEERLTGTAGYQKEIVLQPAKK